MVSCALYANCVCPSHKIWLEACVFCVVCIIFGMRAGLEHLPTELQRNFKLMRDLDARAQTLMQSIDEKGSEFMATLLSDRPSVTDEKRRNMLKSIQEDFNLAKEYGDDKVQLAIQTYELVDKHIRRLDSDLARFEGEIQDKTIMSRSKSEEAVNKSMEHLNREKIPNHFH